MSAFSIEPCHAGSFGPDFIRCRYVVCGVSTFSDKYAHPFHFGVGCKKLVYDPTVLIAFDFHYIIPTIFTITIFSCRLDCPVLPSVNNFGYNSTNTISVVHGCCDISRSKI